MAKEKYESRHLKNTTFLFLHIFLMISLYIIFVVEADVQATGLESSKSSFFGHIHIAKTAGSSFNRILARRYYGVCGHKGYSFMQPFPDVIKNIKDPKYPHNHRNRVAEARMKDWGYHNCALVSIEDKWSKWQEITSVFRKNKVETVALLPCRDPIDHFMSMCNHKGIDVRKLFNHSSCRAAQDCLLGNNRFSTKMLSFFDKTILFKYNNFSQIVETLDQSLPLRALPLMATKKYETNKLRQVNREDTGKCTISTLERMLKAGWSYYRICSKLKNNSTMLLGPSMIHH